MLTAYRPVFTPVILLSPWSSLVQPLGGTFARQIHEMDSSYIPCTVRKYSSSCVAEMEKIVNGEKGEGGIAASDNRDVRSAPNPRTSSQD